MAKKSLNQATEAIANAILLGVPSLKRDKLGLGNRESAWTIIDQAFRMNPQGYAPKDVYRRKPAGLLRVEDNILIHLSHGVGGDEDAAIQLARSDSHRVVAALLNNVKLRPDFYSMTINSVDFTLADSGDVVETDVDITAEYDMTLDTTADVS